MRLHKDRRWPAFELLRERCISPGTPVALGPHAVCLRTDSQEVFAGLGRRGTWGTFITDVAKVWCTWARELRRMEVLWGQLWASISLWAGGEEESIDIMTSFITVKYVEQGRFSGLMLMFHLSAASNQSRTWESSLKYEKVISYHFLFSHVTRKTEAEETGHSLDTCDSW